MGWGEWFFLFATITNVGTATYLHFLGNTSRRQAKFQGDINWMLYQRIVILEKALGVEHDSTQKH